MVTITKAVKTTNLWHAKCDSLHLPTYSFTIVSMCIFTAIQSIAIHLDLDIELTFKQFTLLSYIIESFPDQ